jgi:hypothetical protein
MSDDTPLDLRPPAPLQPFAAIAAVAIVAGGICAAVTGPTGWGHGSWVAAFLVLVVGAGQLGLAVGQAVLAAHPTTRRRRAAQAVAFDAGAALVVAGTLVAAPVAVTAGGLVFLAALVSFVPATRHRAAPVGWPARAYTSLLVVLIASTPIGLALAWLRA